MIQRHLEDRGSISKSKKNPKKKTKNLKIKSGMMEGEIRGTMVDETVVKVVAGIISRDKTVSRVVAEIEATAETIVVAEAAAVTIESETSSMSNMIDRFQRRYEVVVAECEDGEEAVETVVGKNDKSMGVTVKTTRENISIWMMIIRLETHSLEEMILTIKSKMNQVRIRDTAVDEEEEIQIVIIKIMNDRNKM